jgi:hypothetical protein
MTPYRNRKGVALVPSVLRRRLENAIVSTADKLRVHDLSHIHDDRADRDASLRVQPPFLQLRALASLRELPSGARRLLSN